VTASHPAPSSSGERAVLEDGAIEVLGRMPWSSNATFLTEVTRDDEVVRAVYKPERGERPLWDFPTGIFKREIAAYELAAALGWDLVPRTVRRFDDAPLGEGSLQRFIEADFEQQYFTLLEEERFHPQLRRMCAFDLLANNTDRKGGHVLVDADGHLWGIDNGLSFHAEFKLRTVIWDFAGEAVPDELLADIGGLADAGLPDSLGRLLDTFERDAVLTRARALVREAHFPHDETGRRYPWPLV
jgi:uncharacterized repeat protein (TIGR03843 family)